jgi:hypothetical protein
MDIRERERAQSGDYNCRFTRCGQDKRSCDGQLIKPGFEIAYSRGGDVIMFESRLEYRDTRRYEPEVDG